MDIQKLREEFEKLSEIQEGLKHCTHNESTNDYHANVAHDNEWEWHAQFVNGAWYVFQEQQKQINEIKAMAESWINQDYTHNSDSTDIKIQQMKDCGRDIIRKINGELK